MNLSKKEWLVVLTLIIICFTVDPVYAGPGGTVAKAFFRTWWGKLILILLTVIFLPLIVYMRLIEYRKAREIKKILSQLGKENKSFHWLQLHKEFSNIIRRVYQAWQEEDMSQVKQYVNHWYWQNQQEVFLDRWKKENLQNISRLKDITKIRPLYLEISEEPDFENSRIAIAITVVAEDYLIDRDTQKVVEGKKGYDELDYVWFLEYTEGKWLLDDIQEGGMAIEVAKMPNEVPEYLSIKA
jgi:hypothetical protein